MIPHPYHVLRPFTLASPLEQGAIDYRQLATVDDLTAALAPLGVTHVVREPEEEKAAANPIGERVTSTLGRAHRARREGRREPDWRARIASQR